MSRSLRLLVRSVLLVACSVATWSGHAWAAPDACETTAHEQLKQLERKPGTVIVRAQLGEKELAPAKACPAASQCLVVHFANGKKPALPKKPDDRSYAGDERWAPVPDAKAPCADLKSYVFTKAAASDKPAGDKPAGDKPATDKPTTDKPATDRPAIDKPTFDKPSSSELPSLARFPAASPSPEAEAALSQFRAARLSGSRGDGTRGTGDAQVALGDVAAEAVQILGQIVVDRASTQAYRLVEEKLQTLLGCTKPGTKFPRTCAALRSIRIQDIAMAPDVLSQALAADLIDQALLAWSSVGAARSREAFRQGIFPLLARQGLSGGAQVRIAIGALLNEVARGTQTLKAMSPGERALAIAVLAYLDCQRVDGEAATTKSLAACDVTALVEKYGAGSDDSKDAAAALATRLLTIAAATQTDGERVRFAVDTFFVAACMVEQKSATVAELACPTLESLDPAQPLSTLGAIAFAGATADASAAKDWARLVIIGTKLVEFLDASTCPSDACLELRANRKRALRLMAALLDYAATYAEPSSDEAGKTDDSAAGAHAQRTKILESLTEEMTDRTGREGDDIFALGGSLRLLLGGRIGLTRPGASFAGPLSLPLGISYTHIPKRENGWGFHAQLDAIDLGNYLALDNEPNVKTPRIGDAFAPGVTLGFAYGPSLPLVIAATANYMPAFALDPHHTDKKGALTLAATIGVHVPLLDLN